MSVQILWEPQIRAFSFQCGNMAREGLRTLVVAKRTLTEEQYQDFEVRCVQSLPLKALPPYENFVFPMKANVPVQAQGQCS